MLSRFLSIFTFSNATLIVALTLSTIAAWYSIVGLTAIFAGAVIPIIIMGSALELAKITTTVWLRKYWKRCTWIMKVYLVPAVVALALLTSMGIFGFLSKAHLDQNIGSGDVQAKVSLLDEKIAMQRETIKSSKAALAQMDTQVNDIMSKGDSERSVERSVAIRKQQAKERNSLLKDIEIANKEIQKLNEERAPIASEMRKVEAEVGPIKYIAAFIYGDNPDANLLERAVRWVIILLVIVFDPLAIMLVIAANQSKDWDKDIDEERDLQEKVEHQKVMAELKAELPTPEEDLTEINHMLAEAAVIEEPVEDIPNVMAEEQSSVHFKVPTTVDTDYDYKEHWPFIPSDDELRKKGESFTESQLEQLKELLASLTATPKDDYSDIEIIPVHTKHEEPIEEIIEEPIAPVEPEVVDDTPNYEGYKDADGNWVQTGPEFIPVVEQPAFVKFDGDYAEYKGKRVHKRVLYDQFPELILEEDKRRAPSTRFGTEFPNNRMLGDTFVRVDVTPNRVYKYNGAKWIETSRNTSSTYLSNPEYIQFLISKIASGEYDMDLLTADEQDAVERQLKNG